VCCSVLQYFVQCVAVCCSILCSVLQCVAVWSLCTLTGLFYVCNFIKPSAQHDKRKSSDVSVYLSGSLLQVSFTGLFYRSLSTFTGLFDISTSLCKSTSKRPPALFLMGTAALYRSRLQVSFTGLFLHSQVSFTGLFLPSQGSLTYLPLLVSLHPREVDM